MGILRHLFQLQTRADPVIWSLASNFQCGLDFLPLPPAVWTSSESCRPHLLLLFAGRGGVQSSFYSFCKEGYLDLDSDWTDSTGVWTCSLIPPIHKCGMPALARVLPTSPQCTSLSLKLVPKTHVIFCCYCEWNCFRSLMKFARRQMNHFLPQGAKIRLEGNLGLVALPHVLIAALPLMHLFQSKQVLETISFMFI